MRYDTSGRTYWYQWWKDRILSDRQASVFLIDTMTHWEQIFLEETIEEHAQLFNPTDPAWSPIDWAGEYAVEDTTDPQEIRLLQNQLEKEILTRFYELAMARLCILTGMGSDWNGAPWTESDFDPKLDLDRLTMLVQGDDRDRAAQWMLNHGPVDTETILVWFMTWWLDRPLPEGLVETPPAQWDTISSTHRYPTPIPFWVGETRPFSQWVNDLILQLAQRKGLEWEDLMELTGEDEQ